MAQQIKKKFIGDDQVDGTKILLLDGQDIRREDGQGGEVDVIADLQSQIDALDGNFATDADITAVEQGAGLDTDGSYIADGTADYISGAVSLADADSLLDDQVKVNADAIAQEVQDRTDADQAIQDELDNTQAGAGLDVGGSYVVDLTSDYISGAVSLADADSLLDDQIKVNADDISTLQTDLSTEITDRGNADSLIQTELDDTQVGAGLDVDGSYIADATSDYISGAVSLADADSLLDDQVKANADAIDIINNTGITAVQTELDDTQTGAGLGADGSYVPGAGNYISGAVSLMDADELLDAQVKVNADAIAQEIIDRDNAINAAKLALGTNYSEADQASMIANANVETGDVVFVSDDGDAKWAMYIRISEVSGDISDFQKISDQDAFENSISASAIKTSYESNADTNAFTDAEKQEVVDLRTDVGVLQTDLGTAQSDIGTLQGDVATAQGDITSLQSDVGQNQVDISANQSDIGILQGDVATAQGDITSLQSDLGQETLDRSAGDLAIQTELDDTQAGAGLDANGSYVPGPGNYISGAGNLAQADDLLDAQIKINADDIAQLQGLVFFKEQIELTSVEVTAQSITLSHTPVSNSVVAFANRLAIHESLDAGTSNDYEIVGSNLEFRNEIASGGVSPLEAGDFITVTYYYQS